MSAGVLIIPQKMPVAQVAEELLLIWAATEAEEWTNRILRACRFDRLDAASSALFLSSADEAELATQWPTFLDHFEPDEVIVAEQKEDASQYRRVTPEGQRLLAFDVLESTQLATFRRTPPARFPAARRAGRVAGPRM